jgi:serine protease AprX
VNLARIATMRPMTTTSSSTSRRTFGKTSGKTFGASALVALAAACGDPVGAPAPSSAPPAASAAISASLLATLPADPVERAEVIVNFDDAATTTDAVLAAARSLGVAVRPFKHLSMFGALATAPQVRALAALPGVTGVFANEREPLLMYESVRTIQADAVHRDLGVTGKGVGVAIMDSGVNADNPGLEFGRVVVQNVKFTGDVGKLYCEPADPCLRTGDTYVENLRNTDNSSGHGTHVAGTVAGSGAGSPEGRYAGVAPGAHLVGLAVGEGLSIVNIMVLGAADWIIENKAKYNIQIVNNSWGGTGAFDPNDPINEAMRVLHDRGVTVVFAAGNDGPAQNTMNRRSVAPWVISVAAGCKFGVDDPTNSKASCGDGRAQLLANFSSRGIPATRSSTPTSRRRVSASCRRARPPARRSTRSTRRATRASVRSRPTRWSTTPVRAAPSMAAPHIAGVLALMEEASRNTLTPDAGLAALQATATAMPGYFEWEVGAGYVNALAATKAVLPTTTTTKKK